MSTDGSQQQPAAVAVAMEEDNDVQALGRQLVDTLQQLGLTRMVDVLRAGVEREKELLLSFRGPDEDASFVPRMLEALRGGTLQVTPELLELAAAEAPAPDMPPLADVPKCCDKDCLRTLWFGHLHDALTAEQLAKVWAIHARCHPAADAHVDAPLEPEPAPSVQAPAKKIRTAAGFQQLGGYRSAAAAAAGGGGGGGGEQVAEARPAKVAKRKRLLAKFALSRRKKAEKALDEFREESLAFLCALKVHSNASMCRSHNHEIGGENVAALSWLLGVRKHWLYGKRKGGPGAERLPSRMEEAELLVLNVPGQRAGLPETGAALQAHGCCLGNCLRISRVEELDSVLEEVTAARTQQAHWQATKRALQLQPYMCDRGFETWLGRSRRYLNRVAEQDRWVRDAPQHGNTGMVPWNRLSEMRVLAIVQVMEIYTYTDPEDPGGGAVPLRVYTSTQVNTVRARRRSSRVLIRVAPPLVFSTSHRCICCVHAQKWKLYCKFEALWGPLLCKSAARAMRSKAAQQREGSAMDVDGADETELIELIEHDPETEVPEGGEGAEKGGNVCSYSTFARHFDKINSEDGVRMVAGTTQHNCE
jgi:hypothetical protein